MENILVAIDHPGDSVEILNQAKFFASNFDAKLWLLHIIEPTPEFVDYQINENFIAGPQYIKDIEEDKQQQEQKNLIKIVDALASEGISAEGITVIGPTIDLIIEEAIVLKTDLIVIGSHKHGFIYKALIGDVTSKVIQKSNIPLLVVPLK